MGFFMFALHDGTIIMQHKLHVKEFYQTPDTDIIDSNERVEEKKLPGDIWCTDIFSQ